MMNKIWGITIILSLTISFFTGRVEQTAAAAVKGAAEAVNASISLLSIMCLFTGLSKIGEKAGLIRLISKFLRPVTKLFFPNILPNSTAMGAIVMNMVANLLGMGNAATPFGIKAIKELNKDNKNKGCATNDMCMLLLLNTASIQIIPATLISMRQSAGSENSGQIIVPVWIVSILALLAGFLVLKIMERREL